MAHTLNCRNRSHLQNGALAGHKEEKQNGVTRLLQEHRRCFLLFLESAQIRFVFLVPNDLFQATPHKSVTGMIFGALSFEIVRGDWNDVVLEALNDVDCLCFGNVKLVLQGLPKIHRFFEGFALSMKASHSMAGRSTGLHRLPVGERNHFTAKVCICVVIHLCLTMRCLFLPGAAKHGTSQV